MSSCGWFEAPAISQKNKLQHVELVTGNADPKARLPLIVALHGLGDTPQNFASLFQNLPFAARVVIPQAPQRYFNGYGWFYTRARAGQTERLANEVRANAGLVADFIKHIRATRSTMGRPIVLGFSQGAMLSFALAVLHPQSVRAVYAIAGFLPEPLYPNATPKAAPPITAFHGRNDDLVPYDFAEQTVKHLRIKHWPVRLMTYPRSGHVFSDEIRSVLTQQLRQAVGQKR